MPLERQHVRLSPLFFFISDPLEFNRRDVSKTQTNMQPRLYVAFFFVFIEKIKYEVLDLKIKSQTSEQILQVINATINCVRSNQVPPVSVRLTYMARKLLL
jgi:hypothetical protein